jgi:hypothetical protein
LEIGVLVFDVSMVAVSGCGCANATGNITAATSDSATEFTQASVKPSAFRAIDNTLRIIAAAKLGNPEARRIKRNIYPPTHRQQTITSAQRVKSLYSKNDRAC